MGEGEAGARSALVQQCPLGIKSPPCCLCCPVRVHVSAAWQMATPYGHVAGGQKPFFGPLQKGLSKIGKASVGKILSFIPPLEKGAVSRRGKVLLPLDALHPFGFPLGFGRASLGCRSLQGSVPPRRAKWGHSVWIFWGKNKSFSRELGSSCPGLCIPSAFRLRRAEPRLPPSVSGTNFMGGSWVGDLQWTLS